MADIQVNLKVKADAASSAAAARQMSETVQRSARAGKPSGKDPLAWIAQQNANKAAGGTFNPSGGWGGGGGGGMTPGGAAAMGGAAGGVAALIVTAIVKAFQAIVRMISAAIQSLTNAMNRAAALYAKQLQSGGISGGLMAQRSGLASVIGVGEHEVWQYGKAVEYLNKRLAFSAKINAETNRSVTGAAWSMRILGEDFKALAMVAANSLAPAIRQLATLMHALIVTVGPALVKGIVQLFKSVVEVALRQVVGLPFMRFFLGFMKNADPGVAPSVSASAKRMQSSPWERMGMVIGQGLGGNPLKATERNTRSAAQTLKEIKAFLAPRNSTGPNMKAIPNGA